MLDVAAYVAAVTIVLAALAIVVILAARSADRDRVADRLHVGRHRRDELDALRRVHHRTVDEARRDAS